MYLVKQDDTAPPLRATLRDEDTKQPIDLTNATAVRFTMRARDAALAKVDQQTCVIATPLTSGVVEYLWNSADTDAPDTYEAEYEIEWSDGRKQTVPNEGYLVVRVVADLA